MGQTTVRFEFADSSSGGRGGSGTASAPTARSAGGSAAKSGRGFNLLDGLDQLTGGFVSRIEKIIEKFRKGFSQILDIFDRSVEFLERMGKGKTGGGFARAAAKFVPSQVVGGSASSSGGAAGGAAGGVVEGRVLSTTIMTGARAGTAISTATAGAASGGAAGAAGGATAAGSLAGPIGIAVAVAIVAGTAVLVKGIKALVAVNEALRKRFGEMIERAERYSPALQAVAAQAEIAKTLQALKIARRDGEGLARFAKTQNSTAMAIQDLKDTLSSILLEGVNPILEFIAQDVKNAAGFGAGLLEAFRPMVKANAGILEGINAIRGAKRKEEFNLPPEADIFGLFQRRPDLKLFWNGRQWGGDKSQSFEIDKAEFDGPLPQVRLP